MSFARKMRKRHDKAGKMLMREAVRRDRVDRQVAIREKKEELASTMETIQGTLTMLFVAAHDAQGLGEKRLRRVLEKIEIYNDCIETGRVTLDEIEQLVRNDTKTIVDFSGATSPQWQIIRRISSLFLLALHDLFGFGEKVLGRIYTYATKLSKEIAAGKIALDDIAKKTKKIPCIG